MKISHILLLGCCVLASCRSAPTDSDPPQHHDESQHDESQHDESQQGDERDQRDSGELSFDLLPASRTGVEFDNRLDIEQLKSPMIYINVYSGGGVAVGDINNDGLPDLYFTGNQVGNKLYLNKGDFRFEDITSWAGVACSDRWSTGVTMTDVNADGWLDIYVCCSYHDDPIRRSNQLFINNGDLSFTERGLEYSVDDMGYSIVATFLDYDKDGHVDLFVGNHPVSRNRSPEEHLSDWREPSLRYSDHLYRNLGDGTFEDVTNEAGLLNYGWTLGVVAADLNQDDWPDLFVSVDHDEPDRYYLNNGDGTFAEVSDEKLMHMSFSSMGVDAADINNDGLLDVAVLEMLSVDNFSEKAKMASMDPDRFWSLVDSGYHYQYMRNMLYLNMGTGHFSDIGQMAGVHRSDWSWAALLADFDNDGWKDLFVANGYFRDILDKDHTNSFWKELFRLREQGGDESKTIADFARLAPSTKTENTFFRNNGDLKFSDEGARVGLNFLGFSAGAAYADLDLDGDLDLVVSNINDPACVYRNEMDDGNLYLRVQLKHPSSVCPVGTKVTIETSAGIQFCEHAYTRGYQSAVEGILHFGLGEESVIDRLTVQWLDGKEQVLQDVEADQLLVVDYQNAADPASEPAAATRFKDVTGQVGISHQHRETEYDDYEKQVLLPHKMSQFGPPICTGDVNQDNYEDFFIGGGNGQPGALYLQNGDGSFRRLEVPDLAMDENVDNVGAAFLDSDGDGDLDLYVASGGNEFPADDRVYQDRLYINSGGGDWQKADNVLPDIRNSSSCVEPFDFDGDGDIDLFVGGRQVPGAYPSPASSVLLENRGNKFVDVTSSLAPGLRNLGMVTDALWADIDLDGATDLLVVGEWMPLTVLRRAGDQYINATADLGLERTVGWWNRIVASDLDGDGDTDYVVGNLGYNYKYSASEDRPFHVYATDFDGSGSFDIALGYYLQGDTLYPVRGRQCSCEQVPLLAEKFPTYTEFGQASLVEIYGEMLQTAIHYQATQFASSILLNDGNGTYQLSPLPNEAQIAPVNAIVVDDLDGDGIQDILVGGNLFVSEVETGRADAGKGLFLRGLGGAMFEPVLAHQSGLWIPGDVKEIQPIMIDGRQSFLIGNNDDHMQIIQTTAGTTD